MDQKVKNTLNDLIEILDISEADTIFYDDTKTKIRLKKPTMAAEQIPTQDLEDTEVPESQDQNQIIKSERVGIIFLISRKNKKYFVIENQNIKKGDVLGVIVSMKIEYPIKAEFDGIVKKIFIDNAQPVEYGQSLFEII